MTSPASPPPAANLAANVRAEVARRRLRQSDIAAQLGLNQRAMSRRMLGEVEFSATELNRLAELLGMPVARLLDCEVPAS